MLSKAVQGLSRLGLNEYEAKTYAALVALGEGTARQIHDASGVPRPRVYDIIESLSGKGLVEVRHGSPLCYRAVDPNTVISKLRGDFEDASKDALSNLKELGVDAVRNVSPVWYVKGEWSINNGLSDLIGRARQELLVLCARAALLREIESQKDALSRIKCVTCVVTDAASVAGLDFGDAQLLEVSADARSYAREVFKNDLIGSRVDVDGKRYRFECLAVVDARESMLIYEVNGEKTAVLFELPFITHLQRQIVQRIAEGSRMVSSSSHT